MLKTLELLKNKHIKTFPHHKHTPKIEESEDVGLEEVLKVIEVKLKLR
jgi:hypothetical protein